MKHIQMLWFDVEKKTITTSLRQWSSGLKLWFDVEKKTITTHLLWWWIFMLLWFDVEKKNNNNV